MYTYLIVDDEPLIRKGTIKKLMPLSDQLICCAEADNGQEAISYIREFSPDIIILDMQMPIMNGMQLLPYLAEYYPEIPLIVISGYQNFDYMKQAISSRVIDYILKPFSKEEIQKTALTALSFLANKNQLQNQLFLAQEEYEEACFHLEVQALENIILGYETTVPEIKSQKLSFIPQLHHYILFTLYYLTEKNDCQIPNWLTTSQYGSSSLYLSAQATKQYAFLLLFFPENTNDFMFISHFLNEFQPFLQTLEHPLFIGISQPHTSLDYLNTAFRETKDALNMQPPCPAPYSYFLNPRAPSLLEIRWQKEEELLFRIESGMTETVIKLCKDLFSFCRSLPDCTLLSVKRYCEHISSQCHTILNYYLYKDNHKPHSSASILAVTDTLFTLNEVENYYCQFFANLSSMLKPQSVYTHGELIDRICIYIQRNYQKNLTQEFVASQFYLNRSYLSHLFHQKTGEKFIDYLNNIRIEKAKTLLTSSDKKMYQIAKAVGYDNTKYFFRIFKKKTGVSPQTWRDTVTTSKG